MPHLKTRNAHCKQAPSPTPHNEQPQIRLTLAGARPCLFVCSACAQGAPGHHPGAFFLCHDLQSLHITPAGDVPPSACPTRRVFSTAPSVSTPWPGPQPGRVAGFPRSPRPGPQHEALEEVADVGLPDADELDRARTHGMPPLTAASWRPRLGAPPSAASSKRCSRTLPKACATPPPPLLGHQQRRPEKLADQLLSSEPDKNDLSQAAPGGRRRAGAVHPPSPANSMPTACRPWEARSICPCCGSLARGQHRPCRRPGGESALRPLHRATPSGTSRAPPASCAAMTKKVAL